MDLDLPRGPRSTIRSFDGCWTCRLRRKKCDEQHPVCGACTALHIACHFDQDKPEWMDGSVRQQTMVEWLKHEIKRQAHLRREEGPGYISHDSVSPTESLDTPLTEVRRGLSGNLASPICNRLKTMSSIHHDQSLPRPEALSESVLRGPDCTFRNKKACQGIGFERSDTILLTFYLEPLFPFMFPFYHPPLLEGGKSWVLEMMISSPVVRQATLCQSSYFFSLARGTPNHNPGSQTVLTRTRAAFEVLRHALEVIDGGVADHLHGAIRIMTSVMQVQRFEIATSSFNNCRKHLDAALALFRQILDSSGTVGPILAHLSFEETLKRLTSPSSTSTPHVLPVPSAEQAAFRFSSALLVLDDIVASTVLQQQPRLYDYHRGLLGSPNGDDPLINLEAVLGCQNWALLAIGEIAALDAWKQWCMRAGNLDIMELVHRARAVKNSLESHLTRLDAESVTARREENSLLDVFTADHRRPPNPSQTSLVTRVWGNAALLYLSIVVSGWQPASVDIRRHTGIIIELLSQQMSPLALLRTMVWPLCVAGCLAEPAQEIHLRAMVEALQPRSGFGTVHKALDIMESVWRDRKTGDAASRDLAMCFRSQGGLVLMV